MKPYYQDAWCTIYHGSCLDIMPQLGSGVVDLVVTDSAYEIESGGNTTKRMMGGIFDPAIYDNSGKLFQVVPFDKWMPLAYSVLKPNADMYAMVNDKNMRDALNAAYATKFSLHNINVWHKSNKTPNRWYMKCVEFTLYFWKGEAKPINDCGSSQYSSVQLNRSKKRHPTQKPVALMSEYIRNSSQEGDVVLDPFMGSGSTLLAAKSLGRRAIGVEIDERHCEETATELSQLQMDLAV